MTERPVRIGVADAKRQFSDVLGRVRYRGERFVIHRRGTPVAALVPVGDLERLEPTTANRGALGLVGAFHDAIDFPEAIDEVVRGRSSQRTRPSPDLPR